MKVEMWAVGKVKPYDRNPRINDAAVDAVAASIREFKFNQPLVVNTKGVILAGHTRYKAALKLGLKHVPVVVVKLKADDARAYRLADNKTGELAKWDEDLLAEEMAKLDDDYDWEQFGFGLDDPDDPEAAGDNGKAAVVVAHGKLAEKFLVPPFTVLDARQGYWQDRKHAWLTLGIQSELGRGEVMAKGSGGCYNGDCDWAGYRGGKRGNGGKGGTSIFDPVLCELAYTWFAPPGGQVLDPFAGGSARGIVASRLGRVYTGLDLLTAQVEANKAQAKEICTEPMPTWYAADAREVANVCEGLEVDFVFSCPPYADLEVYSDDPRDISTLEYVDFLEAYRAIIAGTCDLLRDNRFACFVVGEVRGPGGYYRNFVGDTVKAFLDAGLQLYNEAILVTAVGSLPVRSGRIFTASRKLGKTHQNVLVFVKGDPVKATADLGDVEVATIDEE